MRKIAEEELVDRRYPVLDRCPDCGDQLMTSVLVGPGVIRPQMKYCTGPTCGYTKDIRRG